MFHLLALRESSIGKSTASGLPGNIRLKDPGEGFASPCGFSSSMQYNRGFADRLPLALRLPPMNESMITPRLFQFLEELREHNHRDWFQREKARYETNVLLPAVELVAGLEKPLAKVAPMLSVIPKKHDGSVMRIYRDSRKFRLTR
jgi:hypothetical protein